MDIKEINIKVISEKEIPITTIFNETKIIPKKEVQITTVFNDGSTKVETLDMNPGCLNCSCLIGPCMPCTGHD